MQGKLREDECDDKDIFNFLNIIVMVKNLAK